ncbi:DgyrCDS14319 [Dimorphilus gyrociliatus]|uniref:DgyrCDS14319 n=1 Tax=Dimorphilus gyrociliatus TaxID=2664684 RepID=A0A7I8WDA5_9ANNE|nr:DgyrCDS14319 [Dimorphilus gyrociliatus]
MALFRTVLNATDKPRDRSNFDSSIEEDRMADAKKSWHNRLDDFSPFLDNETYRDDTTAFVSNRNGLPVMTYQFEIEEFDEDSMNLTIEENKLVLEVDRTFRKKIIRKVDIPEQVNSKQMFRQVDGKIIRVEMPLHLPPRNAPCPPGSIPILTSPDGRRVISLQTKLSSDLCEENLKVFIDENDKSIVRVRGNYQEMVGERSTHTFKKSISKDFKLQNDLKISSISHSVENDLLKVEITLEDNAESFRAGTPLTIL